MMLPGSEMSGNVWIPDPVDGFVIGRVIDIRTDSLTVQTTNASQPVSSHYSRPDGANISCDGESIILSGKLASSISGVDRKQLLPSLDLCPINGFAYSVSCGFVAACLCLKSVFKTSLLGWGSGRCSPSSNVLFLCFFVRYLHA